MTDIKDNPPPLPEAYWFDGLSYDELVQEIRQNEAAAFSRGVAAGQASMQGEIERMSELVKKQEGLIEAQNLLAEITNRKRDELRAKLKAMEEPRKCGDECKRICQQPDPFGECAK